MTASTPDELIAGFLHSSSLPKVTGEPTFQDLKVIWRLLNTNAMSVASYEGGVRHGHLGIIMTNEEYVCKIFCTLIMYKSNNVHIWIMLCLIMFSAHCVMYIIATLL
jgi:hypothetical protein